MDWSVPTADSFDSFLSAWIALGAVVFVSLFWYRAPYGRHQDKAASAISARMGWMLMEAPAPLIMLAIFFAAARFDDPAMWAFIGIWTLHYGHRTFIWPVRARLDGRTMPLNILVMSLMFNSVNGYVNGHAIFELHPGYGYAWLASWQFIAGISIFATGMVLNIASDNALMRLRDEHGPGYHIPRVGMFRYISCPNYLGEILQWVGWAIATWSLAGLSFAVWTIANLAPRARSHHAWYHETFEDYPEERKALIPFIY